MLNLDCRYFKGDRPCEFHKITGVKCAYCKDYSPLKYKILIVKLDTIGNVLRTTSILILLKKKYPELHITWCTRKNAKEIFTNNNLVDEVVFIEEDAIFRIRAEEYDLVINLDTLKFSSYSVSSASAKEKLCFILNSGGYVEPNGNWHGIASDKNNFGQIYLTVLLLFSLYFNRTKSLKERSITALLIVIGLILFYGARSTTALITFSTLCTISIIIYFDKIFRQIGIRNVISSITWTSLIMIQFLIIVYSPETMEAIFATRGKDLSFTGRTDLWADLWQESQNHLL